MNGFVVQACTNKFQSKATLYCLMILVVH